MKPGVTSVVVIGVAFMKKLSLGMAGTTPVFKAYQFSAAMSALGQKLPRSLGAVVSALPPKADADPRAEGVN
jgi:hypothetical protein